MEAKWLQHFQASHLCPTAFGRKVQREICPPAIFFHPQLPENFHLYLCGLNWITWTNLCGWRRTICRLVWNEVTESNNSDRNRISIPQTDGWVSITFKYIWWLHLGIGRTNIVETISISSIAPLFPTTPLTDEEKGLNR